MEFLERRDFVRQGANRGGGAGTFAMEIDAKAAEAFDAVGGISDAGFAETIECVRGKRGKDRFFDFRAIERAGGNFSHFTIDADAGRSALHEKEVAAAAADEAGEPAVKAGGEGRVIGSVRADQRTCDFIEVGGIVHAGTLLKIIRARPTGSGKRQAGLQ